jgi:hypothetical protein
MCSQCHVKPLVLGHNRIMENFLLAHSSQYKASCKGCFAKIPFDQLETHYQLCEKRPLLCPLLACGKFCKDKAGIGDHLATHHDTRTVRHGEWTDLFVYDDNPADFCFIIDLDTDEVFAIMTYLDKTDPGFLVAILGDMKGSIFVEIAHPTTSSTSCLLKTTTKPLARLGFSVAEVTTQKCFFPIDSTYSNPMRLREHADAHHHRNGCRYAFQMRFLCL